MAVDGGQWRLEITLRHLVGRCRQQRERLDILLDGPASEEIDHQHAYQDARDSDTRSNIAKETDIERGYYERDDPVGVFHHL